MSTPNPYSPPVSSVEDHREALDESGFVAQGRKLTAQAGTRWIGTGFNMVFAQFGSWLLISLCFFALFIVLGMIPGLNMLSSLLTPVLAAGMMVAARKQAQGGAVEVGDLFAGLRDKAGPLLICGLIGMAAWLAVLLVSAALVGTSLLGLVFGGEQAQGTLLGSIGIMLLVVLPLWLITAFVVYGAWWLAPALILFNDMAPLEAMKRSLLVALRNWPAVLIYSLLATLALFLGMLLLLVGVLVVVPALFAATYLAYQEMFYED